MSSGNLSWDLSTTFNSGCGQAWEGIRASRVWSGGNQGVSPILDDHPYSVTGFTNRQPRCRWSLNGVQWYTGTPAACFGYPSFPNPWKVNDDLELLGRLVSKIIGHAFNAAVAAAEGSQTLDLIAKRTGTLRKAVTAVEKRNFLGASRYLKYQPKRKMSKDVSKNWLEYQYGWMPLVNDIYEASVALEQVILRKFTQSYRARLTRTSGPSQAGWVGSRSVSKQVICRFSQDLSQAAKLGLLNPEQVLWEKVPYSFIADWVSPIGQFLEVCGVLRQISAPHFTSTTFDSDIVTDLRSIPGRLVVLEGPLSVRNYSVARTISTSIRVPRPQVRALKDIPSWSRAANAVALLTARKWKKIPL